MSGDETIRQVAGQLYAIVFPCAPGSSAARAVREAPSVTFDRLDAAERLELSARYGVPPKLAHWLDELGKLGAGHDAARN